MTSAAYVNGSWRCYDLRDGRTKHFLGCRHLVPASAIAHVSSDGFTPISTPQPGSESLKPSLEPRARDSRSTVAVPGRSTPPSTT